MRHLNSFRRFDRNSSHRKSMFRNMATSFFMAERFETTVEKAKDLRPIVERLITVAGSDTLANRRYVLSILLSKSAVAKLFSDIAPRFKSRNGGYTRIVRTRVRPGDAAEMAVLELVEKKASAEGAAASESASSDAAGAKKAKKAKSSGTKAAGEKATKRASEKKAPAKKTAGRKVKDSEK